MTSDIDPADRNPVDHAIGAALRDLREDRVTTHHLNITGEARSIASHHRSPAFFIGTDLGGLWMQEDIGRPESLKKIAQHYALPIELLMCPAPGDALYANTGTPATGGAWTRYAL